MFVFLLVVKIFRKIQIKKEISRKINNREEFTPHDFLKMYSKLKRNKIRLKSVDQSGCYVFLNKTKNMNYVGQSRNVLRRINQHLNGKGNGDIYADFKYRSEFIIFIIKCPENELNYTEKNLISEFDAFSKGYNRNKGIKS